MKPSGFQAQMLDQFQPFLMGHVAIAFAVFSFLLGVGGSFIEKSMLD